MLSKARISPVHDIEYSEQTQLDVRMPTKAESSLIVDISFNHIFNLKEINEYGEDLSRSRNNNNTASSPCITMKDRDHIGNDYGFEIK